MNDQGAKRYYKKINTTFVGVNKQDEFAKMFINLLKSGNTSLYQRERRERRIFDDTWMDAVEKAIPVIDKLTRNPRENLKKTRLVVPVERAKKTDSETVRHLAANTQLIKSVDREGNVVPSKVLTSYMESDFGTYENRFLKTLVDNLYFFIEKRYDLIIQKMHTEYVNYLNVKSALKWNEANIDFDITLKINQTMPEDEIDRKNQELLNRITAMRTSITNFKMSIFMNEMKQFAAVKPPIQKTNIILKNVDFKQCYDLWVTMDQVDLIGYDVDVFERDIPFEDEYMSHIENAMMVLYATVANNQAEDFLAFQGAPFSYRRSRRPKIQKQLQNDTYFEPGYYKMEENRLNQYFLDQIRRSNYTRFKTLREADISFEESVDIVFKQINQITNAVYEDFIKTTFVPENEKTLEEKIKVQEAMIKLYHQVEDIKREDLRQLSTSRSIALLNLRNFRDERHRLMDLQRAEKKRLEQEERQRKEDEKRRIAEEKLAIKRKIETARKVLKDAELARKKRKASGKKASGKKKVIAS